MWTPRTNRPTSIRRRERRNVRLLSDGSSWARSHVRPGGCSLVACPITAGLSGRSRRARILRGWAGDLVCGTFGDVLRPEFQHHLLHLVGLIGIPADLRRAQATLAKDSRASIGSARHEASIGRLMENAVRRYVELIASDQNVRHLLDLLPPSIIGHCCCPDPH